MKKRITTWQKIGIFVTIFYLLGLTLLIFQPILWGWRIFLIVTIILTIYVELLPDGKFRPLIKLLKK